MINLLFTGNDRVFDGLAVSLVSIIKHCKEPLNVSVMTMDLTSENPNYKPLDKDLVEELEKYIQKVNLQSKINLYDVTSLFKEKNKDSANMENSYSPYAFLRLLADEVEEIPDKVLYLDVDIVAAGNIKELYDYDVDNYEYGAVKDYYGRWFINPKYINSGVMLLNMKKIRQTKLFEKCRHLVNTKKMGFPDQTALNKEATSKLYLPSKFNSQRRDRDEDVIRHFCKTIRWLPWFHTLNIKPWNIEGMHKKLKCHKFDDVINEVFKFKERLKQN